LILWGLLYLLGWFETAKNRMMKDVEGSRFRPAGRGKGTSKIQLEMFGIK
jgi:hypothetical protein